MTKTMTLVQVLRSGRQADPDGVEVRISRQAVEEAAAEIERLDADAAGLQAELASVKACWSEALANITARNQEIERLKDRLETQKGVIANHIEDEREIEQLQMSLKRYESVSLYNGHDIDWWKAEAERLRAENTKLWGWFNDAEQRLKRGSSEPSELRLLFNKGIGVQRGNGFSFAFPTEEDANQAFHYICDLGTLQTSQPPKSEASLRTPQGEPALTQTDGLPGTREPVVTAPQGIAGESPALFQQEDPSRGAGSELCEQPSREQLLQFARTILSGTTNDGLYNGRCPQELWNEFFPMDEPGVVTPEFAAEFERGTMGAILKELGDFVQGRDQPYWAGFEFALEEVKCRLDMAWKALPTEQSEGTRSDEVVRFDANRKIIGCTCPDEVRGKPMPAPDPNCPISFPHAEVAWGKRRRHNDDSPLGAKIRAGEQQ